MPCTNPTAPVALVNGGPVVVWPSEIRFNAFSASMTDVSCNTGAGACGQTGAGNATFNPVEVERTGYALAADIHVSVYVWTPSTAPLNDYTLASNNIVATMPADGTDPICWPTLNLNLNENEVAVLLVWFPASVGGIPIASVVAIASAAAGQCA